MSKSARERRRNERNDRTILDGMARFQQTPGSRQCLLCGEPSHVGGVWMVQDEVARRLLVPSGKARVIFYALCARHARGHAVEVERTIIAQWEQRIASVGPNLN